VALNLVGAIVLVWAWWQFVSFRADGSDLAAYYGVRLDDLYATSSLGHRGAYLYSPAFAVAITPLTYLPWPTFYAIWTGLEIAALALLLRPALAGLALITLPFVQQEIGLGNVELLMALALVLGFRYPVTWTFMLLTKVTPGIGLLWFAVRREWQSLIVISVATLAAVLISSSLVGWHAWAEWIGLLARSATTPTSYQSVLPIAFVVRLPIAAALVAYGAWRGWPWVVPIGAFIALPIIWSHSYVLLLAVIPLVAEGLAVISPFPRLRGHAVSED
jgi:Flp pilus assembly protein protease CpaA